jgi:antitoxin YefM
MGNPNMTVEISYSQARQHLASLLDDVTDDREIVIIRRRKGESAALISADELASLTETAHLLRSPANASRLLEALARALKGGGRTMTVKELRKTARLAE